jgi:O-antigen/teichoic acid export membrane protein
MGEHVAVGRGATSLFLANILSLVASTFYFVILTNVLRSTKEVGVVTALNILIWFFVLVCLFAQPVVMGGPIPAPLALLKFVPEFLAKSDYDGAKRVFRVSLISSIFVGLVIVGVLFSLPSLVIPLLGGSIVLPDFVRLSAIDILVLSVGQICVGAVIALGYTRAGAIYIIIWSIVRSAFASILLVPYGVVGILIGWIGGDVALLLLAMWKSFRNFGGEVGLDKFSAKNLVCYSVYTLFAALLGFIINQADIIIAFSQQGLSGLAIYNVASIGSGIAGYAPSALITVLLPALAASCASNKTGGLHSIIRSSTRYVSLLLIPIAFGLAALMEIPLNIFGPDYVTGLLPAVILSVATGLTALSAVYAGVLLALGRLRWYTAANLLGLIALILVAGVLTPIVGLNGPALGRATLMVVTTVVYALATFKAEVFEIDFKTFIISVVSSTIMMIMILSILSVLHDFILKFAMLPVLLIAEILIYVGSLRAFGVLTVSDVYFIRGLVPYRFRAILPILARVAGLQYRSTE